MTETSTLDLLPERTESRPLDMSKTHFASGTRQLIKLVTDLRALGVQTDFDLPRVTIIGNRSAGKSSLVEAISGISVPRADGTCTRCPLECRLANSERPWQCQVRLRRKTDDEHVTINEEPFGPLLHDESQLEDMIRRAQRAILNPGRPAASFMDFDTRSSSSAQASPDSPNQLAISSDVVFLDLSGPGLPDLLLVDLPGIISNAEKDEDKVNINFVRTMAQKHIEGKTLILLAIAMCDDINEQEAMHLVQLADPNGSRTIGVLTKPDLIQDGEEHAWLEILEGTSRSLKYRCFVTKHPSPNELEEQATHNEARDQEAKFFGGTPPWALKPELRSRMSTSNLIKELSTALGALISPSLSRLRANATKSLNTVASVLESLPPPPSGNPALELMRMVTEFAGDFKLLIHGVESHEALLQKCRPAHQQLKWDILSTAPNFRPFKSAQEEQEDFQVELDMDDALDENRKRKRTGGSEPVYLEDVRKHIQSSLTRQHPPGVPVFVKASFVERCFDDWEKYCMQCLNAIHRATEAELDNLVQKHFGRISGTTLIADVRIHCSALIKKYHEEASKLIRLLLKMEDPPFTVNDLYFSACRNKFLAEYKAARRPEAGQVAVHPWAVQAAITQLATIGYKVTTEDLVKLQKDNTYEEELIVMAETSAYFRVAYKRVIDNIPRAVDHAFVRAISQDLCAVLTVGLFLTAENSNERATAYLAEDPQTTVDRKDLSQKKERLHAVLHELLGCECAISTAEKASSYSVRPVRENRLPAVPAAPSMKEVKDESSLTTISTTPLQHSMAIAAQPAPETAIWVAEVSTQSKVAPETPATRPSTQVPNVALLAQEGSTPTKPAVNAPVSASTINTSGLNTAPIAGLPQGFSTIKFPQNGTMGETRSDCMNRTYFPSATITPRLSGAFVARIASNPTSSGSPATESTYSSANSLASSGLQAQAQPRAMVLSLDTKATPSTGGSSSKPAASVPPAQLMHHISPPAGSASTSVQPAPFVKVPGSSEFHAQMALLGLTGQVRQRPVVATAQFSPTMTRTVQTFASPTGPVIDTSVLYVGAAPVTTGTANPLWAASFEREPGCHTTVAYMSISCMPTYRGSSVEELRLQDYQQGRRKVMTVVTQMPQYEIEPTWSRFVTQQY